MALDFGRTGGGSQVVIEGEVPREWIGSRRAMHPAPSAEQAIRAWFDRVRAAALELPDGWFGGRPYDNQHELTFLATRPRKLLVELDERLLLVFTGLPVVEERELDHALELELSGFMALTFDWQEYGGSEAPHATRYPNGGEVTFGFLGRPRGE